LTEVAKVVSEATLNLRAANIKILPRAALVFENMSKEDFRVKRAQSLLFPQIFFFH